MNTWLEDVKKLMDQKGAEASIMPRLIVRKNDQLDAVFLCPDPRLLVRLATQITAAFEADELILLSDSYQAHTPTNPEGKRWSHGEMQRRADEPAVAALLQECLMLLHVRRGVNSVDAEEVIYKRANGKLIWQDPMPPADGVVGLLPDGLLEAVHTEYVLDRAAKVLGVDKQEEFARRMGVKSERLRYLARMAAIQFVVARTAEAHESIAFLLGGTKEETEEMDKELAELGLEVEFIDTAKRGK